MIQSIFRAITVRIGGLQQAAFWLALFSGLSLLLGFVRDRILAHYFGAGLELDMYYAAFEIPDILFVTAASVVSASILVPMFALRAREPKELASFINTIFSYFSVFIVIACALAFVFMPELVQIFFGGFEAEASKQVIYFSRILLLSPLFLGFSNFFGSIIQYEKRFLLYSLSPLLYNTGIIGGLAFGAVKFGIVSAVFGVVIGAFLHMAIQAIFVFSSSERPRFEKQILSHASWLEIKKVFTLSIPRAISLSAGSLVGLFFVAMASRLSVGSIAVFTLAFNLQAALLSLVGGSFSMAAFPTLSEHYVKKEI
ncbi:MAG: lipid II flippase MurJ, partial [Patescibacteria group bacterium]